MRGIVFTGEGAEVAEDLEVRAPGPSEVCIRVAAAGVCHSDVSVVDGTIPWPSPSVLGHEGAGIVGEVGPGVTSVSPGDHVVITTLANCGMCGPCTTGHPTWCRRTLGNVSEPFSRNGEPVYNFAAASVFAERTVVREIQVVPIPDDVPLSSACLVGCGVVTGVGAVFNRAHVSHGQSAAVFGVGGVGLNVIQALRLCDAGRVVAVDTVAAKEGLARRFGATDFVDASSSDAVACVRELFPFSEEQTTGAMNAGGVDWSFDCVGNPGVLHDAIEVLDWGGNCIVIGVPPPEAELSALIGRFTYVDRGLLGCRYGSIRPHHDVPMLVELYRSGRLKLDELVSATYPLEGFDQAVADMHDGVVARGVLEIDG